MMEQQRKRFDDMEYRRKYIEYSCGCKYLFDHQIVLEHVCPIHEGELITSHG